MGQLTGRFWKCLQEKEVRLCSCLVPGMQSSLGSNKSFVTVTMFKHFVNCIVKTSSNNTSALISYKMILPCSSVCRVVGNVLYGALAELLNSDC